eukprot:SAG31_NODE_1453_length_8285_cov_11.761544_7_plen_185_part_00
MVACAHIIFVLSIDLGYSTHAVGKWVSGLRSCCQSTAVREHESSLNVPQHLGYSSWRFTPVARGFDTYKVRSIPTSIRSLWTRCVGVVSYTYCAPKGYLDGAESYWCHGGCGPHGAVDWWDSQSRSNMSLPLNPVFNETCHNGTDACPVAEYSASLIGDRAVELIHATPADPQHRPMFMCVHRA